MGGAELLTRHRRREYTCRGGGEAAAVALGRVARLPTGVWGLVAGADWEAGALAMELATAC